MGSAYKNGVLVIDPILHTYDDLIATLVANGYEDEIDLFTFPYEWRNSNVFSANLLDAKVEDVKAICDCDKVDIVAHSMGGLVTRAYIQSSDYDNDVDQLIFLGTPHKGAPTDYTRWEAGKFSPDANVVDVLTESFFEAEALRNGYLTIFDYIHNRPILSVQELLPVFDYLKDEDTGIIREYPNNYPRNNFLENLQGGIHDLINSGVRIINIVGDAGQNTVEVVRVIPTDHPRFWEHGEPEGFGAIFGDDGLERGFGDNTVTVFGATLDTSISNENSSASHRRIPTTEENKIFKILTGKDSITNIDNGFNISPVILLLQLKSPIDFVITDPDKNKIGKNFQTGEEYNEVPNAFYSGYEADDEYITILDPLDGEYKIELQGTGGGNYAVLTSYISDQVSTTTEIVGITTTNQITDLNVVVDNDNPLDISLEKEVTLEILLNDIRGAYNLGWIKDTKTRDYLLKKSQDMYKNGRLDKRLAKGLLTDLKNFSKDRINEKAYNIIKEDLEWLINN